MNMLASKKNKIKDSLNKTKIKRKSQTVSIIKTKIDSDKLNRNTVVILKKLFLEAKWLYNYVINNEFNNEFNNDIFNTDYKLNEVPVYVKNNMK